jgi:hypothetical protein
MATFTTYAQVGLAEDVSNVITNISPTKTPFQTLIGKSKIEAKMYEWQEDALRAAAENAVIEGADAGTATHVATVMRSNYAQIVDDLVQVSGTAERVKKYGRKSELAYQTAKKLEEIKRDVEYAMIGAARNAAAGDATSNARTFGNILGTDAGSVAMVNAANVVTTDSDTGTSGNQAGPLTEANLLTLGETLYDEGVDPNTLLIPSGQATNVANFAAATGRERDIGSAKKLVNAVDLYVGPHGEYKVVIDRFMLATVAMLFDPKYHSMCSLRPFSRTRLAKTGDSDKFQILGEIGYKHMNYKASGYVANLS